MPPQAGIGLIYALAKCGQITCALQALLASGASRDRTGDLLLAKQALSQLSYGPWRPSLTCGERRSSRRSAVEVEVARRPLLEPQPVVIRRVLEELRRLLEHVFALGLLERASASTSYSAVSSRELIVLGRRGAAARPRPGGGAAAAGGGVSARKASSAGGS